MEKRKLEGKVIVVSGGTKGVGRTVAEEFGRAGAKVVIGGRDEEAGKDIVRIINTYGSDALFVRTDVRKVEDCRKLFKEAYDAYGQINGFFNYAGVTFVSPLDTCDQETFDSIMETNFRGAFFCCQEAVNYMRKSGGGSIVLTGSPHAWGGEKDRAAYACSKGVLLTLTDHIAKNYGEEHIRCNYLTLGWTPTDGEVALRISQGMTEEQLRQEAAKVIPMGRMNEKSDYVGALLYLMSDESVMMSGSTLMITGGLWFGTSLQNANNSTICSADQNGPGVK